MADNAGFVEMAGFPFPLLSDPDRAVGKLLDVERDPDDRFYGFPRRITYLIDPDLVIRRAYQVSQDEIADHPGKVLSDLQRLRKEQP